MRQQFGQLHAALPARMKFVGRAEHIARLFVEMDLEAAAGIGLAAPLVQRGFAIEEIHLARTTMLEQADNGLCARAMMAGSGRIGSAGAGRPEQVRQGKRAKAARRATKES